MNSQTRKWNADAAKAQAKERQDQVAATIKKVTTLAMMIRMFSRQDQVAEEEILANAALMAAAPEMLEALELVANYLNKLPERSFAQQELLKCVNPAIAKAKGGAE